MFLHHIVDRSGEWLILDDVDERLVEMVPVDCVRLVEVVVLLQVLIEGHNGLLVELALHEIRHAQVVLRLQGLEDEVRNDGLAS